MSLYREIHFDLRRERMPGALVGVDLDAHFRLPGGAEHRGRVVRASSTEVILASAAMPHYGDGVVIYVRELGHFEGDVERLTAEGFAANLHLTARQQSRLAAQLIWFANRDPVALPDTRRHKRIVPRMPWTRIRLPDGREKIGKINDVSASGVSVDAATRVSIGERVAFGLKTAVVGRVFEGGFVAQFDECFPEDELSESILL